MPIDLSLVRVSRLLASLQSPHRAYKSIHVAGTNGKGSILAYLSSIFTSAKISNGRFTSPHMLYPNDSVCINNCVYPKNKFEQMSLYVKDCDAQLQAGCTEFELLTVTAFMIFRLEKVQVALVEVGLGGRLDATNVLEPWAPISKEISAEKCQMVDVHASREYLGTTSQEQEQERIADTNAIQAIPTTQEMRSALKSAQDGGVIATAISKIGMDHENILGKTLDEIAFQKAGIIKPGIPCIVDSTNEQEALEVIRDVAAQEKALLYEVSGNKHPDQERLVMTPLLGQYQKHNLSVALTIIDVVQQMRLPGLAVNDSQINEGIARTRWQGRLQTVKLDKFNESIIIDGAHNESAAIELGKYLQTIRGDQGIIFIVGMTQGKDAAKLFRHISVRDTDTLFATRFTQPHDMPWIEPMDLQDLQNAAEPFISDIDRNEIAGGIHDVVAHVITKKRATNDLRPIVVCGSLYLCGDVLRGNNQLSPIT